ncbi:MAG: xanthine dehydrogenase family protein subunit M [Thermincola sp.]|jgi:carbon-monoxide dehydrogenase medium subunit|nr:xanthine dehydrogenase family protein subunit M [Thermincola sp.]MDT3701430.1 xanthine dehydrogenase family protein subunit M [Thermincola sp.]
MKLPEFVHLRPDNLQEASALLCKYGNEAKILAGGTDLLVKMKHRRALPRYLVNIKRIPDLAYIDYDDNRGLRIGALATIEELKGSIQVKRVFPILHQAAAYMATVEVRNRATVVGNICNGSPSAETAPALIALGAKVRVVSVGGERIVPVEEFFAGPGRTVLHPGEVVAEIQIPVPLPGSGGAYDKHSLRRMDVAIVGVGTTVVMDGEICTDVRIALSAVAPTPVRAKRAEACLRGQAPTAELIEKAAGIAREEITPITDIRGTAEYRKKTVAALAQKVIKQAFQEVRGAIR